MAFAQIGMLEGNEWDSSMSVEGYEPKPGENMNPFCNAVSPGYFKTMQIPLVAGRDFDESRCASTWTRTRQNALPLVQGGDRQRELREEVLRRSQPIGRHIGFGTNPGTKTPIEIVGVVKDAKYMEVATTSRARCISRSWRTISRAAR
jgi:hypothetical protein